MSKRKKNGVRISKVLRLKRWNENGEEKGSTENTGKTARRTRERQLGEHGEEKDSESRSAEKNEMHGRRRKNLRGS